MADAQPDIRIFNQTEIDIPLKKSSYTNVTSLIADNEQCSFDFIEVVYVDEDKIVRLNKEHLDRDYITDIITFRYDAEDIDGEHENIEGTLFCCAPRILEQAKEYEESPEREFLRIFIHGLLHLGGYDDQSEQEKENMTAKEEKYLDLANLQ